jgi:hypothetical protein
MFSVVKFTEENSVGITPTSWLTSNSSKCKWPDYPPGSERLKNAIKKGKTPESDWIECPVKVLKQYGKYYSFQSVQLPSGRRVFLVLL